MGPPKALQFIGGPFGCIATAKALVVATTLAVAKVSDSCDMM